ncbi:dephospho-CoA kinase [Lederbergia lenta]|uniref:dephospho-CoA kinase n=1 Tax=Lederbergia lenta TaxID=1467 RepID=UPI00203DBF78|nr:dephospho-CoA kinase [Lederbergia lenta]MCM3111140.1 dephospho-CoA kinase [Lederbergia lenta]
MAQIIGLTGGIASGKSTISNMLGNLGFTIVDADIAARAVMEPGEQAYTRTIDAFGKGLLLHDGKINREKLGSIIFHDDGKRELLNSIVHPAIREKMSEWKEMAIAEGKHTIIYDVPLLYESKLTHLVSKVILIYVDEAIQLERLMARNNLTEVDAKARIASQLPLQEKVKLADAVIDNNDSLVSSRLQLEQLIEKWNMEP